MIDLEKMFKCRVCNKSYSSKKGLLTHMNVHDKLKAHQCQVCQKMFKSSQELIVHIRAHTGEKPFACSLCGKRFSQQGNLSSHFKNVHIGRREFKCPICPNNKCFKTKQQLDQHLVRHEQPQLGCENCGKKFHFLACLKAHVNKCVFFNMFPSI